MVIIEIEKEQLEYIKNLSDYYEKEFPYPLYLEYNENKSYLLLINCGKFFDYFTHVEVFISNHVLIQNLKFITNFKKHELIIENIRNTNNLSKIDLDSIIKNIF